ncbi:MAG: tyrosine-type recombinase/integrase [Gemmatimonadota bacterium]|nr:MAG: tyrosine-type recombinase/integrase [Gemmatimonadota bacterium]
MARPRKPKSKTVGDKRGSRVRIYEREPSGPLYLSWWENGQEERRAQKHRNWKKAEVKAKKISADLFSGVYPDRRYPVSEILDLYLEHRTPGKTSANERASDRRRTELWKNYLGSDFDLSDLSRREWDAFVRMRRCGELDSHGRLVPKGKRRSVGEKTVRADLAFLRAVCRWAVAFSHPRARGRLLKDDPTRGFDMPRERNPKRPAMSPETYGKLLDAARRHRMRVTRGGKTEPSYLRDLLVLAWGTGRRISAICQLQHGDWLPDEGRYGSLRWRADSDKAGREMVVPVTRKVRDVIELVRRERPGVGSAWLFPRPFTVERSKREPLSNDIALQWLKEAADAAKVKLAPREGWHAIRRAWVGARRHLPPKDVAEAGGWLTPSVVLDIYTQADEETVERVVLLDDARQA